MGSAGPTPWRPWSTAAPPTGLDQLFDVADAGEVMPPKSTWFEPKLREGVAAKVLD